MNIRYKETATLFQTVNVLIVAGVFVFISYASIHVWRTGIINYDLIHDTKQAMEFLRGESLPSHGSVASFGVFNPPGVSFSLIFALLFFPEEPSLATQFASLFLSLLTVVGIYLLCFRRFGSSVAMWACLIFLVSSTGWYFIESLRPRAHPVFLVWSLYFLDTWVNENKNYALSLALMLVALGMYWMLEITPLVIPLALIVIVNYKKIRAAYVAIPIIVSGIIWMPYLSLQWERDFKDIHTLLISQSPAFDLHDAYLRELQEAFIPVTEYYRAHDIPGYNHKTQLDNLSDNFNAEEEINKNDEYQSKYVPLGRLHPVYVFLAKVSQIFPTTSQPLIIIPIFIFACLMPPIFAILWFKGYFCGISKSAKSYCLMLYSVSFCALLIFCKTYSGANHVIAERSLWLWAGWAIIFMAFPVMLFSKLNQRYSEVFVHVTGLIFVLALYQNNDSIWKTQSLIRNNFRMLPESEFHLVINYVAEHILETGNDPAIGYDLPFLPWVVAVRSVDGTSRIGLQYDVTFEHRHGIKNMNTGVFSVSPNDVYRIVEHSSQEPWRQTYLNLSEFPSMKLLKEFPGYTILIRPDAAPHQYAVPNDTSSE
jgi:hypothetical protein